MKQHPAQIEAFERAKSYKGLQEIRGTVDEPKIVAMFADVGHSWVKDDETAWCAAFVGAMLERSDLKSTRALNARSYEQWGDEIDIMDALPGDIAVFRRGPVKGWQGHVAFVAERVRSASWIEVLGGNQGNEVGVDPYSLDKLLSVRRMPAPKTAGLPAGPRVPATVTPQKQGNPLTALISALKAVFGKARK
jgi:uncharacterized protein (TIGR02594 family)